MFEPQHWPYSYGATDSNYDQQTVNEQCKLLDVS